MAEPLSVADRLARIEAALVDLSNAVVELDRALDFTMSMVRVKLAFGSKFAITPPSPVLRSLKEHYDHLRTAEARDTQAPSDADVGSTH